MKNDAMDVYKIEGVRKKRLLFRLREALEGAWHAKRYDAQNQEG